MDATSLALSWLLLAQAGGGSNPFFRDTDASPRRTAPAATIQEEQPAERNLPAERGGAAPWNDRKTDRALKDLDEQTLGHNRTLQREAPTSNNRTPLFREGSAANTGEAPAWGGGAAGTRTSEPARTDAFGTPEERRPADNTRPASWDRDTSVRPISGRDDHIDGALIIPLRSHSGQITPSEVLSQAMTPPPGVKLPGRPVTLLDVVSRSGDRAQQLRATKAYWRLAIAEAEYNWRLDTRRWTSQLVAQRAKPNDSHVITTLQASAVARLTEAELAVVAAQHEIIDMIDRADNEELPLAADLPFVGNYRTYFHELFADREAPGRTRVIDRSLPIRREQIDARTKAVFSADEAMHTAIDEYNHGQTDVHALWGCLEDLHRERLMFLNAVRDYNYDIAEYAVSVANGGTPSATLVGMMIRATHATASPSSTNRGSNSTFLQRQPTRVRPTDYQEEDAASSRGTEKDRPAEFMEQRKPVSVMVSPDRVLPAENVAPQRDRVQHADFHEDVPNAEPRPMPPLVPLQAARETPKKPVSVMVRPVRE